MLEGILIAKSANTKTRITVKSIVAAALIALAVGLPQLVHLAAGASGGVKWLPMYMPVLIAGCVLGVWWGIGVGVLSPIISFAITSAFGNAMPAAARLPYMIAELATFAAVAGMFSKHIPQNKWLAFPAVLLAAVAGRTMFITLVAIFQSVSSLKVAAVWAQIQTGMLAVVLQSVLVPLCVIGIACVAEREAK